MTRIPRSMWTADYVMYIGSPDWRARRLTFLARANGHCERCGKMPKVLQVHHKTYIRQGAELPEDVEVICGRCHMEHHGLIKPKKKKKVPYTGPKNRRNRRQQRNHDKKMRKIERIKTALIAAFSRAPDKWERPKSASDLQMERWKEARRLQREANG